MDKFSVEQRSLIMSHIRSVDTKPEMVVREYLHKAGFRYRLHAKDLPGKPDIVLPKYKTVVEIRGCFWHHHEGCKEATSPTSHTEFWQEKFRKNRERDKRTEAALIALGWRVIILWECEIKTRLASLPGLIRGVPELTYVPVAAEAETPHTAPVVAAAEGEVAYVAESCVADVANDAATPSLQMFRTNLRGGKERRRPTPILSFSRRRSHRGNAGARLPLSCRRRVE